MTFIEIMAAVAIVILLQRLRGINVSFDDNDDRPRRQAQGKAAGTAAR